MTWWRGRARALLFGFAVLAAAPAAAQRSPVLEVTPPGAAGGGAIVSATNLFAESDMRELVRSGFPASLHYRLELWRTGGFFDDIEGHIEWEMIVQYDPSAQRYRVVRRQGGKLEDIGTFATLSTAQATIERPTRTTLAPERERTRYYYSITLDIEALSVSDMDQLERWLRGARSGTAVAAVGTGLRTLMLRMLGGEKKHFTNRSPVFLSEK
jgi:hypothetical protein